MGITSHTDTHTHTRLQDANSLIYIQNCMKLRTTVLLIVLAAMTDWIQRWKKDGWKKVTGNHVTNKDDFRQLDKLANGIHIKWVRSEWNIKTAIVLYATMHLQWPHVFGAAVCTGKWLY